MGMSNVSETVDELNDDMKASVLPVTVFIGIETVVGFFGNMLILLVYFKRYRRINFRYFVLALAIVDLTSCCTTLPGEIFSQLNWYKYEHAWICKVKSFFNVFTAWGSASILLVVAVDRYRKICHPLHWQIRYNVAFRLCLFCLLISALAAGPITVLWGKMTYIYVYKGTNVTVSVCEKSNEYANTPYPLIYILCVYIVPVGIMIIVAMTLNFMTARKLFWGHSATPATAHDNSAQTGSSTAITSESLDGAKDDETGAGNNKVSDIKGSINKCRINDNIDLNVSKPSNTFRTMEFQHDVRKIKNDPDIKISRSEEISIGYFRKNTQKENKSFENEQTEICNKTRTFKFKSYRKSKTMIMLVLTLIFAVTMTMYIILTEFVAKPGGILKYMPDAQKSVFFFFWRLYFINSVINPILYGFMDAKFRSGMISFLPSICRHGINLN